MSEIKKVFVLDLKRPYRAIEEKYAKVVEGPKMAWADFGQRRGLLGSSAFFKLEAAIRSQNSLLLKNINRSYLKHKLPELHAAYVQRLKINGAMK